jgi:galactokinase
MNHQLINYIRNEFIKLFKEDPCMVFSPGRINLIGEHTDYNDGFVLPAAIDMGIISALTKSNTNQSSIVALDLHQNFDFSIHKMNQNRTGTWKDYVIGVIIEIKKLGKSIDDFNLVFGGNIPNGAGLSSSAALENSIVFGLNELFNLGLSKLEMILISQNAEHNQVGVQCGIMDQYASMFGQENNLLFLDCRTQMAIPIVLDLHNFEIILVNTNVKHSLAESEYNKRRLVCESIARLLQVDTLRDATEEQLTAKRNDLLSKDFQMALFIIQENNRVTKAVDCIKNKDINSLGSLLYESHIGLQKQYKVSCPELDFLVENAKNHSEAVGARMMGGGFGGCTINIIDKNNVSNFSKFIQNQYKKKFNKNCSIYQVNLSNGTHLIKT